MKYKTYIISAFPGTGKSYIFNNSNISCIDSDSSQFSWIKDSDGNNTKERNSKFPQNYIEHIKKNIGKYEFIFVSSHKEVRDALIENCLFFYSVWPDIEDKPAYIQRYKDRGNDDKFIEFIFSNWNEFVEDQFHNGDGYKNISIPIGSFLEDGLAKIVNG